MNGIIQGSSRIFELVRLQNMKHWKLFRGRSANANQKLADNFDMENHDIEEAISRLEYVLDFYPSGSVMTIVLVNGQTSNNKQAYTHTFKHFNESAVGATSSTAANISGMGNSTPNTQWGNMNGMFQMFQMMQNQMQSSVEGMMEYIKDEKKRDLEMYKLQQENKALKDGTFTERLADKAIAMLPSLADRLLAPKGLPSQMGVAGVQGFSEDEETTGQAAGESSGSSFSFDLAIHDIGRIQQSMPDYPVNQMLTRLADYCEKYPDQAKSIIDSL